MAADPTDEEASTAAAEPSTPKNRARAATESSARTEETEEEDEDEEDEEPRLKYSRLTGSLAGCYRSDSTSSFVVAGDKMVCSVSVLDEDRTC